MNAGRYTSRLSRGVKPSSAQLYVKRRTTKRGHERVLVTLPAPIRYALCVWASYHASPRERALSQEIHRMIWEAVHARLGPDADIIVEQAYLDHVKKCREQGIVNIFEAVSRAQ